MALLNVGDEAPDFTTTDQEGREVTLKDFRGRKVVLYFYPKDDTPGCTTEACSFRDNSAEFERRGVEVLGVSTDTAASHKKFVEKFSLPFTLLADTDKSIVESYGAWGEKKNYGRTYMGTHRITYLIDEKGKIAGVFPKVTPAKHVEALLKMLDGA